MGILEDGARLVADSGPQWRKWLLSNHTSASGIWLITNKTNSGKPALSYSESVEVALCFGWIDSRPAKLEGKRMLWFTPRKPGSGWSRVNKERIERLEAAGLIQPSGKAAIDRAKEDGSWSLLDAFENLEEPDDLSVALNERPPAREKWDAFPKSERKRILHWVAQAKTEPTRRKRVLETAEKAKLGERANQWKPKERPP
jgi:uncharacterized protein YdeI (YjbR/CyaY-like superfamily)